MLGSKWPSGGSAASGLPTSSWQSGRSCSLEGCALRHVAPAVGNGSMGGHIFRWLHPFTPSPLPCPCLPLLPPLAPLPPQGIALYFTQPHSDCVAGPGDDCSEAADASIPWRVLFFLACIPGAGLPLLQPHGCVGPHVRLLLQAAPPC